MMSDYLLKGAKSAASDLWSLAKSTIVSNAIRSTWFNGVPNFGDLITPALLRSYGLNPVLSSYRCSQVVVVGSVLDFVPPSYSGCILGSGFLYEDTRKSFRNAEILAVRGPLTRERLGAEKAALGDPGLLAGRLLGEAPEKKYEVGFVPHFRDIGDARVERIAREYPDRILTIDVRRDAKSVIRDIARCDFVISSSLHGVIVSDALNIPNKWMRLSEKPKGGFYKFRDYFLSVGSERQPIHLAGTEDINELIDDAKTSGDYIQDRISKLENVFDKYVYEYKTQ